MIRLELKNFSAVNIHPDCSTKDSFPIAICISDSPAFIVIAYLKNLPNEFDSGKFNKTNIIRRLVGLWNDSVASFSQIRQINPTRYNFFEHNKTYTRFGEYTVGEFNDILVRDFHRRIMDNVDLWMYVVKSSLYDHFQSYIIRPGESSQRFDDTTVSLLELFCIAN